MSAFFGETPGADFVEAKASICKKCKGPLIMGLLRNATGTLKWRNFDGKPLERGGLRYYVRHVCPAK